MNVLKKTGATVYERMLKNRERTKKALYYISGFLLTAVHLAVIYLVDKRLPYLIDSDVSSELILGKLLSQENAVLSKNWYYSTELRVLNTQLIYSFFFHFSDNWHTVRILSAFTLHVILSLSTVFMCRKAGLKRYSFAVAAFMLSALSEIYANIVLVGCFYIPHIAVSFVTIGFAYMYSSPDNDKKKPVLILSSVLSLSAALGGIRQIVITYFPMAAASFILSALYIFRRGFPDYKKSKYRSFFIISLIDMIAGGIGYILNHSVLSRIYTFMSWDTIGFKTHGIRRIDTITYGFMDTLGFKASEISPGKIIADPVFAFIAVMILFSISVGLGKKASANLRFMTVFFLCAVAVYYAIYMFTDMKYRVRFNIPVAVLSFPLIAMALHEADLGKVFSVIRPVLAALLAAAVLSGGAETYIDHLTLDRTGGLVDAAAFLSGSEYKNGYATFWNANVLTELSGGELTMYPWENADFADDCINTVTDIYDLFKWLQLKEHVVNPPQGKVFALYKKGQIPYCRWREALYDSDIIFETSDYIVYGYDSYSEAKQKYDGALREESGND